MNSVGMSRHHQAVKAVLGAGRPFETIVVSQDLAGAAHAGQSAADELCRHDGSHHVDAAGLCEQGIASHHSHLVAEHHLIEQDGHQNHRDDGEEQT